MIQPEGRAFRRRIPLLAIACALAFGCGDPSPIRPNIVFIATDDQAFSTLRYLPHVERDLASKGTTFENFILNDPICCPSRVAMLLGRDRHDHVQEPGVAGGCTARFSTSGDRERSVGSVIQGAGYRTGLIGKYLTSYCLNRYYEHLRGDPQSQGVSPLPGWDDYHVLLDPKSYFDFRLHTDSGIEQYDERQSVYQTDVFARLAREFIEESAEAAVPFFLYVGPRTPHAPTQAAKRHARAFPGLRAPRGPAFNPVDVSTQPSLRRAPRLDRAAVARVDRTFRRHVQALQSVDELVRDVVAALRRAGALDNTYVFFTSDNGWHFGEHRQARGHGTAFEESIRFPLIVRGPGVPRGVSRHELISNADLHPTFLDLIGAAADARGEGRSLLPLLRRDGGPTPWRQSLAIESVRKRDSRAVPPFACIRTARYKLVAYRDGSRELYDIEADPAETRSVLSEADASVVRELEARLSQLLDCTGAACRAIEDQGFPSADR